MTHYKLKNFSPLVKLTRLEFMTLYVLRIFKIKISCKKLIFKNLLTFSPLPHSRKFSIMKQKYVFVKLCGGVLSGMQEYLNKYDILYQCKVLYEFCGKCRSAECLKIWVCVPIINISSDLE